MKKVLELADRAVETAKDWDMVFDYSADSIASLEKLAQKIFEAQKSQNIPKSVIWNAAATYGAYLGETLMRNGLSELGFQLAENEDGDIGLTKDNNWMFPMTKVYKRLTNGPEDALDGFFDVSLALARGEIEL